MYRTKRNGTIRRKIFRRVRSASSTSVEGDETAWSCIVGEAPGFERCLVQEETIIEKNAQQYESHLAGASFCLEIRQQHSPPWTRRGSRGHRPRRGWFERLRQSQILRGIAATRTAPVAIFQFHDRNEDRRQAKLTRRWLLDTGEEGLEPHALRLRLRLALDDTRFRRSRRRHEE